MIKQNEFLDFGNLKILPNGKEGNITVLRWTKVLVTFGNSMVFNTPYIRLVKFQLVRQIPDVYVSACVLAGKLFCCILHTIPRLFMV